MILTFTHAVLHEALKQAVRLQLVSKNIMEFVDKPKRQKFNIKPLTQEQLKAFVAAIAGERHYMAYLLVSHTGLRRGELLGLRWQDIDFDRNILTVSQGLVQTRKGLTISQPKTEASRRSIPLHETTMSELKSYRVRQAKEKLQMGIGYDDSALLFSNEKNKPLDPRSFTRNFHKVLEAAGLPKVRFHDMRHTHATLLLQIGENVKVVQERLGHTTSRMTLDTYSHVLPGMQQQATDKIYAALR